MIRKGTFERRRRRRVKAPERSTRERKGTEARENTREKSQEATPIPCLVKGGKRKKTARFLEKLGKAQKVEDRKS